MSRPQEDDLKNDNRIVGLALSKNGKALQHVSAKWKDSEAAVKIAVGRCGSALRFASARLKDDEGIVKLAVGDRDRISRQTLGYATSHPLYFASIRLQMKFTQ